MQYSKALDYLNSRETFGIRLGLANIRRLLKKLGNPHKSLNFIHVAGTNGKGSCCAIIKSALQEQGYKVGMYTSPHLIDFEERIIINDKRISKKDIARLLTKIKPFVTTHTYFEIATTLAFLYFKEKNVDFVVAEVGMGGRLDATNVITPLVSVITNISLEHKEHLGNTIEKIAYEKAGIIKKNIPTVTSAKNGALKVMRQICKKRNSELHIANINNKLKTNLNGRFQLMNASTSLKTIKVLRQQGIEISDKAIAKGFNKVLWPGRMQFISKNILLDCAHNPAAVKTLKKEIKKLKYKNLILLTGILKDKNIKEMITDLSEIADDVIITKSKIHRAADPEFIAKQLNNNYAIIPSIKKAVKFAKSVTKKEDLLLITGSIYTVGEAMQHLI